MRFGVWLKLQVHPKKHYWTFGSAKNTMELFKFLKYTTPLVGREVMGEMLKYDPISVSSLGLPSALIWLWQRYFHQERDGL